MTHELTAVVLATDDAGLVPAAYSSENPTFGVGPGNVPVFVERTANVGKAARDILAGKGFYNGMTCASEKSVVVDAPLGRPPRAGPGAGGYFLSVAEARRLLRVVVTRDGRLNSAIIGKSSALIALMAGIRVPPGTRCLIAEQISVASGADYRSRWRSSPRSCPSTSRRGRSRPWLAASKSSRTAAWITQPEYTSVRAGRP